MRPLIGIVATVLGDDNVGIWDRCDGVPRRYAEALVAAGAAPVLLPCHGGEEIVERLLSSLQGVLISGGDDIDPMQYGESPQVKLGRICPPRDGMDRLVVHQLASRPELPVLGICRGCQALNIFAGGSLYQDLPSQVEGAIKHSQSAPGWYGTHEVQIAPGSKLAGILGTQTVTNTFHHQAVKQLAEGFVAVAHAPDGVVEAIEKPDARFCVGVQFHPEIMAPHDAKMAGLFEAFVAAC